MSWTFYAAGKPLALIEKVKTDLGHIKCAEPEESIKAQAIDILTTCLTAYPPDVAVKIIANGRQDKDLNGLARNNLLIELTELYGFVE